MVFMLVLLTVIVFISAELFFSKRKAAREPLVSRVPAWTSKPGESLKERLIPKLGLDRYYHPGHTWASVSEDGSIKVGFDDFTRRFIGRIDSIDLPRVGDILQQGGIGWKLKSGQRILPQVSAVGGKVVEVNDEVSQTPLPDKLRGEKDWVLRIDPVNLKANLNNLLHGHLAQRWMEIVRTQFIQRFVPEIGPVYQDGGELVHDLGSRLTDQEWKDVVHEFFLSE